MEQQEKVNVKQREIDMLYGGRIGQIMRNLEADLRLVRDRKARLDFLIQMPALP